MIYLLIRHGQTDANRLTRTAFGHDGAPLNELGKQQALKLQNELLIKGIDVSAEPVVVSELIRTQQTAEVAGFKNILVNKLLNEINTGNPQKTLELIAQAKLPEQAHAAAKAILAKPPREKIWITHGLVIAALLIELGLSDPQNFIPNYCEIIEVSF